jgi:predicted nucleic-acid-binding protein
LAARATAALEAETELLLVDLVVAECVYVLESFYEVPRPRVAEVMRAVIAFPSIRAVDPQSLLRALEIYEVDRLDFAEAYLVAHAEATSVGTVLSFDKSIDRVAGQHAGNHESGPREPSRIGGRRSLGVVWSFSILCGRWRAALRCSDDSGRCQRAASAYDVHIAHCSGPV